MSWYRQAQLSQKGWEDSLGDIQRYVLDAYDCRIYITRLANRTTVSLTLAHYMYGHTMFQDFWQFEGTERSKAKSCFRKVKSAVDKVFNEFKTGEIPTAVLHSYIREAVRHINIESKPRTRIPCVDWAKKQDGVTDWRNSIYGNRYPESEGY